MVLSKCKKPWGLSTQQEKNQMFSYNELSKTNCVAIRFNCLPSIRKWQRQIIFIGLAGQSNIYFFCIFVFIAFYNDDEHTWSKAPSIVFSIGKKSLVIEIIERKKMTDVYHVIHFSYRLATLLIIFATSICVVSFSICNLCSLSHCDMLALFVISCDIYCHFASCMKIHLKKKGIVCQFAY